MKRIDHDFEEITKENQLITDENLKFANFKRATFKNCRFVNCDYQDCSFELAIFENCIFTNVTMTACLAKELEIQGGKMHDCSFHLIYPSLMVLEIEQTDTIFNFSC